MCTTSTRSDLSVSFNDTSTTEIYTLSLHDALPISNPDPEPQERGQGRLGDYPPVAYGGDHHVKFVVPVISDYWKLRSEEHMSELQSCQYLVCRLLLEKKKINNMHQIL